MFFDIITLVRNRTSDVKAKNKGIDNPYLGDTTGWLGLFLLLLLLNAIVCIYCPDLKNPFNSASTCSLVYAVNSAFRGLFLLYIFVKLMRMRSSGVTLLLVVCIENAFFSAINLWLERATDEVIGLLVPCVVIVYFSISRQVNTYYPKEQRQLSGTDTVLLVFFLVPYLFTSIVICLFIVLLID